MPVFPSLYICTLDCITCNIGSPLRTPIYLRTGDCVDVANLLVPLADVSTCAVGCVDAAIIYLPSPDVYHCTLLQQTSLRKLESICHSDIGRDVSIK